MALTTDQRKAVAIIKNYLNVVNNEIWTDDYIMTNYDFVVDQIIENATNLSTVKPSTGILSLSEGGQSVTFEPGFNSWSITDDVKNMLPKPFIKMFY
ncbi:hypothetical protein [Clostridium cellulovorans]|uniref:Uncharacterized protein n=1 Tax=Clostridium cellulovorans (strain ATCC 35296 / DSM 3052 / OCM 3 / 743B) TaxID=573061 RepID=D9SWD4_CLOC7|nr:hypothetical protein [Clostridium cellulovorans]ADL53216.1 hypothetical protein Clocel_3540 [Clostridium cellulovorans 743B]